MFPQGSHITRKRGVYYYRRRLPLSAGEVALSLRTRIYRRAEWLAHSLDQAFKNIPAAVLKQNKVDVARIVRDYLKRRLEFDLALRADSPHSPVYALEPDPGETMQSADLRWVDTELRNAKSEFANRLYEHQGPLIDSLMARYAVPEEQRNEFAFEVLRANVEIWETIRKRTLGEFPPVSDSVRITEVHQRSIEETVEGTAGTATEKPGAAPTLSEWLPGFLAVMAGDYGWRGQTLAQNRTTYRMFIECCGDRPLRSYTRTDLTAFYDLLRGLPRDYAKSSCWRGTPLREIVAQSAAADLPRVTMKTIRRHFSALGRLFSYAIKRGEYVGDNPARGFDFPTRRRAREARKEWTSEQLGKLFASPVWTGCRSERHRSRPGRLVIKDDKYWLPLLGIYHGARLEECAQLRRSDIREEEDIHFIDINNEDGKQLKNEQSRRRVPIHPQVIELGFLDYVREVAPRGSDRIFPLLSPGGPDKKLGFYFTKWWSRYRRAIGMYEAGLDYHSFRHTVATALGAAGVHPDHRRAILGHEGQHTDERVYVKDFSLSVLLAAVSRLDWPSIVSALNGSRHV